VRRWLVLLALAAPGCVVAEYTIGGASASAGTTETCPDGQVSCGDGCAPAGACDDCPDGQVKCDGACVAAGECAGVSDSDGGCPEGQDVCGDGCSAPDACPCAEGCDAALEVCAAGACVCRPRLSRCGGRCVDTRGDPAHCGDCDAPCDPGRLCQAGVCVAQCDDEKATCAGACVDVAGDSLHCGECDDPCAADEVCVAGDCRPYVPIPGCSTCPCADACESGETGESGESGDGDMSCCDSPFLGVPVCVDGDCA
jgi:hypothetical protein